MGTNTQEPAKDTLFSWSGTLLWHFVPNLSTLLHALNELMKADKSWRWTPECVKAFTTAKEKLPQAPVLAHFDPEVPLRLAGDASA